MNFKWLAVLGVAAVLAMWGIGSYNSLISKDEEVKAQWAQVQNQYQRRSDLIPNFVETVKGYASHEREALTAVIQARAAATQTKIPENVITDPAALQKLQDQQGQLGAALGRLMVVVERYPELKANAEFAALRSELAGTENRIAVARRDYIGVVREFNSRIRSFPTTIINSLFTGFKPLPNFSADAGAGVAPKVSFGK